MRRVERGDRRHARRDEERRRGDRAAAGRRRAGRSRAAATGRRRDPDLAVCLGRRRHDAARADAVPRHRRAGDRRQLRPRRVPDRDPRRRARAGHRARLRRRVRRASRCPRSRSSSAASTTRPSTTPSIVSGTPGRIIEISYSLGGEDLGTQPCDGLLCATPPGSTAYNLSNGGPVLVWGLDAAVLTFVAPHTLHARPLVVGPDFELEVVNRTPDVEAVVLADGRPVGSLAPGERSRCGSERAGPARHAARADVLPPLRTGLRHPLTARRRRATGVEGASRCSLAVVRCRGASAAAHREPRAHPGGRARARPRAERDHGRDGRREDDPLERDRSPARRAGRGGDDRSGRPTRRMSRPSSTCRTTRPSASSPSSARRARRRSCSRGGSSPTDARAPTPGAGAPRARTSRRRSRRCSR